MHKIKIWLIIIIVCYFHCKDAVPFTHGDMKEIILSKDGPPSMPFRPALVLFTGLSGAQKSSTLEKVMKSCESPQPAEYPGVHNVACIASTKEKSFRWREVESHLCDSFCLQSAIHYASFLRGESPMFTSTGESLVFASENLNRALQSTYERMRYFHHDQMHWRKALPMGLMLMKIWDVGFSSGVRHSLSMLTGYHDRSLPCLFIDLQRDVDHLHEPPERTEELDKLPDASVVMRRRSRLEYFLRFAAISKSVLRSRAKACLVVAVHDGTMKSTEIQKKLTKLKEELFFEAEKLEIDQLIDDDFFQLSYNDEAHIELLKARIEKSLQKVSFVPELPHSWLFLRAALECTKEMFVTKVEVEEMAEECNISLLNLEQMLSMFTSYGSLVYLPEVPALGDNIILQPVEFAFKLNRLFDSEAQEYGIITQELAKKMLGKDVSVFLRILSSARMAIPVPVKEISFEGKAVPTKEEVCHYMPSIKTGTRESQCDASALHVVVNHDIAPINRHVTLISYIQECLHTEGIHTNLVRVKEPNITCLLIKMGEQCTTFKLVYQGDVSEVHLYNRTLSDERLEKLCSIIVTATIDAASYHSKVHGNFKYNFGRICMYKHSPACTCKADHIHIISALRPNCDCTSAGFLDQYETAVKEVRTITIAVAC